MSHVFANPVFIYVAAKAMEAVLGSFGTWLESSKRPWISKLGYKIEAFTIDLPKLFEGKVHKEPEEPEGDEEKPE